MSFQEKKIAQNTAWPSTGQKNGKTQSSQVLLANHHDVNEDTSNGGDASEFQEPEEPVEEPSEKNLSDSGEAHERSTKQPERLLCWRKIPWEYTGSIRVLQIILFVWHHQHLLSKELS